MSIVEKFVDDLEASEKASDMYFSLYFVPEVYQPQESTYET